MSQRAPAAITVPVWIERLDPGDRWNFRHFRMRHMLAELLRRGVPPGTEAPDFDRPSVDGSPVRLSELREGPVLLHFVSYTCPVTRGGMATMRELHRLYGGRVTFVEMLVRQAHPGEVHDGYRSFERKLADARAYVSEERVPWVVAVDDLAGTVQRAYGGSASAAYLIDRRGVIAFCGTWGPSPALRVAIDDLLARGGAGAPAGSGTDRRPHLMGATVFGRSGPRKGGRRALIDLELGFPGANLLMLIGSVGRPVLAPLAVRTEPVPRGVRALMLATAIATCITVACALATRRTGCCRIRGRLCPLRPHDAPDRTAWWGHGEARRA